jgi:hypothetical protein
MTREEAAYRLAIRIGMLPADVEDALLDAAQAGQALPSEAEIAEDAQVTPADVERGRQYWMYADFVPLKYKRLLTAVER